MTEVFPEPVGSTASTELLWSVGDCSYGFSLPQGSVVAVSSADLGK